MPNDTEAMALALIRLLREATHGQSMEWRTIRRIDCATDGAVALAVEQGWLQRDRLWPRCLDQCRTGTRRGMGAAFTLA